VELVGGAAQPIGLGERARMVGFGRGVVWSSASAITAARSTAAAAGLSACG